MTKTLNPKPENPFQKEGEVCESCRPIWEVENATRKSNAQVPFKIMVGVRNAQGEVITTRNHNIEIVICPYCDGDLILKLARENGADSAIS